MNKTAIFYTGYRVCEMNFFADILTRAGLDVNNPEEVRDFFPETQEQRIALVALGKINITITHEEGITTFDHKVYLMAPIAGVYSLWLPQLFAPSTEEGAEETTPEEYKEQEIIGGLIWYRQETLPYALIYYADLMYRDEQRRRERGRTPNQICRNIPLIPPDLSPFVYYLMDSGYPFHIFKYQQTPVGEYDETVFENEFNEKLARAENWLDDAVGIIEEQIEAMTCP